MKSYSLQLNGTKYVLIDTPGFDDPLKSDTAVVDKVLQWLETSYRAGRQLSGIIYLHRIIDPRMQGSALRNMRMFRKLCGPDCYKNVVLATTFWNKVSEATGQEREKELMAKDEFWGQMVKKGSQVVRLGRDKDSALGVIGLIKQDDKILLQAQKELVLENKSRDETAAAVLVNEEAKKLEKERQRRLAMEKDQAERQLRAREAERARKAKEEKDRLAAELEEQGRLNRERQEQRERQEKIMQVRRQKAKDEATKAERARVAEVKARIKEQEDAQRRQQEAAARKAAQRRAQYYRSFRCGNITPRGYCDRCKVHKLSRYKYYFREYFMVPFLRCRPETDLAHYRLLPLLHARQLLALWTLWRRLW